MTTRAQQRARNDRRRPRRPLLRSFRFWIPITLLLILLALAAAALIIGPKIFDRAMAAKDSLEEAIPLAATTQQQILAGESEQAQETAGRLAELTAAARSETDDETWKNLEWLPVLGTNLKAVRTAAAVTDDLVTDALVPATALSLNALTPKDGAIDLEVVAGMEETVANAADAVNRAADDLASLDHTGLIPQVTTALNRLETAVGELQPMLDPAKDIIAILPKALGAEGPRNYLLLFQNNAESRGTGGNPAAIVMLTADNGRFSISEQASSNDFNSGRATPIMDLDHETVALYGDKIGRYVQDTTLSPDFSETAEIIRAFWSESFDTPVDAVASFDPVALSYLLEATGPVSVGTPALSVELNADNAVPMLLNQVYAQIPDPDLQDEFFAAAAATVFNAVVSGRAETKALLTSFTKAVDESRLLYTATDEAEAALVGESRLSGRLPATNEVESVVGVYVNDITQGKLDYYMQLDIDAQSTQCQAEAPVFSTTATLTNTLDPGDVAGLATYISPGRFFPKGQVSTDLVLYGPVGSTFESVTVDGKSVKATALPHLGRPAVKVNVRNDPGQTHAVAAEFSAPAGEYGPLSVRQTPMVKDTPVTLSTPGCE